MSTYSASTVDCLEYQFVPSYSVIVVLGNGVWLLFDDAIFTFFCKLCYVQIVMNFQMSHRVGFNSSTRFLYCWIVAIVLQGITPNTVCAASWKILYRSENYRRSRADTCFSFGDISSRSTVQAFYTLLNPKYKKGEYCI